MWLKNCIESSWWGVYGEAKLANWMNSIKMWSGPKKLQWFYIYVYSDVYIVIELPGGKKATLLVYNTWKKLNYFIEWNYGNIINFNSSS